MDFNLRRQKQQIPGVFKWPVAISLGIQNRNFRNSCCRITDIDVPAVGNILDDGLVRELDEQDVFLLIVHDSHVLPSNSQLIMTVLMTTAACFSHA